MRYLKKSVVIILITAFALILNTDKINNHNTTGYCDCGNELSHFIRFFSNTLGLSGNNQISNNPVTEKNVPIFVNTAFAEKKTAKTKVTFIELGSVNCIPCKMMQPVMKRIEQKYSDQVKVIFYDVWTQEGKPYAYKYNIKAIPTQVYLNSKGKEFFRHQGFHSFEDVEKILKKAGVR